MIKSEFKRIADKENGKLSYKDQDISIGGGVRSPKVIYLLKIDHKGNEITILNETGTSFVAKVMCQFSVSEKTLDFELDTRSHLSTLFSRKKNRFKITGKNPNLDLFFYHNDALRKLNDIAGATCFEPHITGKYNNKSYELATKYHLQFEDWTQVLEPLIDFHKTFIDEFGG